MVKKKVAKKKAEPKVRNDKAWEYMQATEGKLNFRMKDNDTAAWIATGCRVSF